MENWNIAPYSSLRRFFHCDSARSLNSVQACCRIHISLFTLASSASNELTPLDSLPGETSIFKFSRPIETGNIMSLSSNSSVPVDRLTFKSIFGVVRSLYTWKDNRRKKIIKYFGKSKTEGGRESNVWMLKSLTIKIHEWNALSTVYFETCRYIGATDKKMIRLFWFDLTASRVTYETLSAFSIFICLFAKKLKR